MYLNIYKFQFILFIIIISHYYFYYLHFIYLYTRFYINNIYNKLCTTLIYNKFISKIDIILYLDYYSNTFIDNNIIINSYLYIDNKLHDSHLIFINKVNIYKYIYDYLYNNINLYYYLYNKLFNIDLNK